MTEQLCPFTEEQLAWLKDNLTVSVRKGYDSEIVVRLYVARELICEAET
jgi:hypothetical protein